MLTGLQDVFQVRSLAIQVASAQPMQRSFTGGPNIMKLLPVSIGFGRKCFLFAVNHGKSWTQETTQKVGHYTRVRESGTISLALETVWETFWNHRWWVVCFQVRSMHFHLRHGTYLSIYEKLRIMDGCFTKHLIFLGHHQGICGPSHFDFLPLGSTLGRGGLVLAVHISFHSRQLFLQNGGARLWGLQSLGIWGADSAPQNLMIKMGGLALSI